jgi:hypothetical protein
MMRERASAQRLLLCCLVVVAGLLMWRVRTATDLRDGGRPRRAMSYAPPPDAVEGLRAEVLGLRATVAALGRRVDAHTSGAPAVAPAPAPPARLATVGWTLTAPERNKTTALLAAAAAAARGVARGLDTRKPYFLHLHKAGGTTICHVARMRVPPGSRDGTRARSLPPVRRVGPTSCGRGSGTATFSATGRGR